MPDKLDTSRPFTRAQARRAGIPDRKLRLRRYRRIFRTVLVRSDVPDSPWLIAQAALLLVPGPAWASHATAGRVHGFPLPALPGEHVSVPEAGQRRRTDGVTCHLAPLTSHVVEVEGVLVSSAHQAFVELAGQLPLVDLVVVGDHLVRWGRTTPERLVAFCAESDHRHAGAAARAAAYVRRRVDSPMETRLRMLLVLAGLPEPEVNLVLAGETGILGRKYDLSYPAIKVIVEYDGRHHIEREEQWESDLGRREEIDDAEWRILVVTARGIHRDPEETVMRVWRLLRRRGLPGVPARPSDDWRAHFPVRR